MGVRHWRLDQSVRANLHSSNIQPLGSSINSGNWRSLLYQLWSKSTFDYAVNDLFDMERSDVVLFIRRCWMPAYRIFATIYQRATSNKIEIQSVWHVWALQFIMIGLLISFSKARSILPESVWHLLFWKCCIVLSVFFPIVWITSLGQKIVLIFISFLLSCQLWMGWNNRILLINMKFYFYVRNWLIFIEISVKVFDFRKKEWEVHC